MKQQTKKPFIVGDVHGCFREFLALLNKINYKSQTHRLILVGDIINRGPHPLKMLKWVRKQQVEMVRGNHEQAFIEGVRGFRVLSHELEKLKKDMKRDLYRWIEWLETFPFYIEEKDFLVVHAGLVPKEEPKHSNPHFLMNIRTWDGIGKDIKSESHFPWYKYYKKKKLVIYGHWANQGLNVRKNSIGLDTGCVYGRKLSGVLLPERKVVQVPALKSYYPHL